MTSLFFYSPWRPRCDSLAGRNDRLALTRLTGTASALSYNLYRLPSDGASTLRNRILPAGLLADCWDPAVVLAFMTSPTHFSRVAISTDGATSEFAITECFFRFDAQAVPDAPQVLGALRHTIIASGTFRPSEESGYQALMQACMRGGHVSLGLRDDRNGKALDLTARITARKWPLFDFSGKVLWPGIPVTDQSDTAPAPSASSAAATSACASDRAA